MKNIENQGEKFIDKAFERFFEKMARPDYKDQISLLKQEYKKEGGNFILKALFDERLDELFPRGRDLLLKSSIELMTEERSLKNPDKTYRDLYHENKRNVDIRSIVFSAFVTVLGLTSLLTNQAHVFLGLSWIELSMIFFGIPLSRLLDFELKRRDRKEKGGELKKDSEKGSFSETMKEVLTIKVKENQPLTIQVVCKELF